LLALYAPLGTQIKYPLTPDGKRVKPYQKIKSEWVLTDLKMDKYSSLRLTRPGSGYSILIFWNTKDMGLRYWYINLEEPLHRTAMGFELTDYFLDVIVEPDLSGWCWKDEDEFTEAVDLGLITKEKAAIIRDEGERVAKWLQSGNSPFNGWENWRPDPSWKVPVLPDGWDKI
jgi:predicted RNA-binding protein associated with RNAse of E/G family